MMGMIEDTVNANMFVSVLLCVVIIAYFCYKEWPELKQRIAKGPTEAQRRADACKLDQEWKTGIEKSITEIEKRQHKNTDRMNELFEETIRQKALIDNSLQERQILMRGIMACLDGLEQQGCNHTVTETKNEINNYLNDIAHKYHISH